MGTLRLEELVYNWNSEPRRPPVPLQIDDETLRDGLQSPSVKNPPLAQKIRFLHLIADLGIDAADLGLPGAGGRALADVEALCREIVRGRLGIAPNCAARTIEGDMVPAIEVMQRVGCELELMLFTGASPIRCYVEGWPLDELVKRVESSVRFCVKRGAPATFVIEDTTRSQPDDLRRLIAAAVREGAQRVCIADTAGHATPAGATRIVAFIRGLIDEMGGEEVKLDWHGHNDRGLAVANALAAARAGVDRLHATLLGAGERVGNPAMEQILVNVRLLGWASPNLSRLMEYVSVGSEILSMQIPPGAPIVGRDAFRTSTGVHAAAIVKAGKKGVAALEDLVYSAVPAAWFQRRQDIAVGPMSGTSNVRHWLLAHGYVPEPNLVQRILAAAKDTDRTLSDEELHEIVADALRR